MLPSKSFSIGPAARTYLQKGSDPLHKICVNKLSPPPLDQRYCVHLTCLCEGVPGQGISQAALAILQITSNRLGGSSALVALNGGGHSRGQSR